MALAWLIGNHPGELRADFQRYYQLNLDGVGEQYTFAHAACLACNLPSDSATLKAMYPRNGWTQTEYLLHAIEYDLRVLIWQNSKDGAKGKNKPKPLSTPEELAKVRRKATGTDFDFIAKSLGLEGRFEDGRDNTSRSVHTP